jgi:heme O synthase-like polyprenyltransferase
VRAPSQRRALGALFLVLACAFAGIAVAAFGARVWVVAVAAAVLGAWMLGFAVRALRRTRG